MFIVEILTFLLNGVNRLVALCAGCWCLWVVFGFANEAIKDGDASNILMLIPGLFLFCLGCMGFVWAFRG